MTPASEPHRIAIYAAPAPGSELARRAAGWFEHAPRLTGVPHLVDAPRHYGFHATLKAPFRLAAGVTRDGALAEIARLAAQSSAAAVDSLAVSTLGRFVALVPGTPSEDVASLAARCVVEADHLRRPADPEELARRRQGGLSVRQDELLVAWGYPYVLDQFRFHFTVSCDLDEPQRRAVVDAAGSWFEDLGGAGFRLDHLCVFEQAHPEARFVETTRLPLGPRVEQ